MHSWIGLGRKNIIEGGNLNKAFQKGITATFAASVVLTLLDAARFRLVHKKIRIVPADC